MSQDNVEIVRASIEECVGDVGGLLERVVSRKVDAPGPDLVKQSCEFVEALCSPLQGALGTGLERGKAGGELGALGWL